MRLYELELYNYIGIYNGLGLDKITIPFYKCNNFIVVIKGDNGSGKSTIYKALHPFSDPNDALVPGKNAYKKISYVTNKNELLEIKYSYPYDDYKQTRKTTKCSVQLNHKELNANNNMTSGKEIIENLLGIDSSLMNLAQLSSDDRGLADKKPAKRKEFLNKNINDIDAFNEIYKKISKGTSTCKALLDSMTVKLKSIGDVEKLKANLQMYNKQYSDLDNESTNLLVQASKIQAVMETMIDNNKNPEEKMNEINNGLFSFKGIMKATEYDKNAVSEEESKRLDEESSNLEKKCFAAYEKRNYIIENKRKVEDKLETIQIKLDSMKDIELLNQYKTKLAELESKTHELVKVIEKYGYHEEQMEVIHANIKDVFLVNKILNETISYFTRKYSQDELENALNYLEDRIVFHKEPKDCRPEFVNDDVIDSFHRTLKKQKELLRQQDFYKKNSVGVDKIPKDCIHKNDCPFVMNITKAHNSILSDTDYNKLIDFIYITEKDIEHAEGLNAIRQNALNCALTIKNNFYEDWRFFNQTTYQQVYLVSDISIRLPDSDRARFKMVKQYLLGIKPDWYVIDIERITDLKNASAQYMSIYQDIKSYKETINKLSSNQEVYETLNEEYKSLLNDLKVINEDKDRNDKNIKYYENELRNINTRIEYITNNLALKKKYDEAREKYDAYLKEKTKYEENAKKYKDLNEQLDTISNKNISMLNNQMSELRKSIDSITYNLRMYNEYVKEYNEYKKKYSFYNTLKKYTSPTTGIQTVYAEIFMNSILSQANDMLALFFGGEFQLQPFVINANEFRMPVLGSGIMNDDISSMSNAQVCMTSMILSFVLMSKASDEYNIIKLDEIDGALDTNNRSIFFNALYTLMNKLQFEQCVLISHNSELNTQNMDMIILKNTDSNMKLDGNVIYNYNS